MVRCSSFKASLLPNGGIFNVLGLPETRVAPWVGLGGIRRGVGAGWRYAQRRRPPLPGQALAPNSVSPGLTPRGALVPWRGCGRCSVCGATNPGFC